MKESLRVNKFEIGAIYKILPKKKDAKSRLVMIAEIDESDHTALVFLLNNMTTAAIPRDVNISKEKIDCSFDIVIMTEYFSRIDLNNLSYETQLGKLPKEDLARIRNLSFNMPLGALPTEIETDGISIGKFPVQKFDTVWQFRSEEFDNFSLLTFVRNKLSSDYVSRILSLHEDLIEIIDDCPLDALFLRSRESVGASL